MPVRNDGIRGIFNRVRLDGSHTNDATSVTLSTTSAPAGTTTSVTSSTTTAPDGMTRNTVVRVEDERLRAVDAPRRTRAELIAAGRKNGVPQRVQIGPTCGLYALGMVMDFWNEKDPKNASPIVQDQDLRGRGKQYTREPTTSARILDVAKAKGFTSQGEMFTARQLALTAKHFGYDATTHTHATLDRLYKVLDAGHPAIVAFDVDYNGNPADYGGERAHYAVIEGYVDEGGERYLVARHGWGVQTDHLWKASDFDKSWKALQSTTYYGTPGDGVIPKYPGLREPRHMHLPDLGDGKAGIFEALGCKIVEVVPKGEQPVGGTRA